MFNISYNNHKPEDYNAWLATIPIVTHSSITRTRQTIPFRDGDLLGNDVSRGNAHYNCMVHMKRNDYVAKLRTVRQWLSGEGILKIYSKASDTPDSFFEVLQVSHTDDIRRDAEYGRLSVDFEIYPYEFLTTGDTWITDYATISNTADACMPEYEISGTGIGTLTVNGNNMTFNVSTKLTINTRLQIAINNSGGDANADVGGDYAGLYLKTGNNSVSISSGFTLKVKPHWGYKI